MKALYVILLTFTLASCGKIPAPSILSPSEDTNVQAVSFGVNPSNYQKILKDFLKSNLQNYQTAKVEFINKPSKIKIDHLGDTYIGYRVCLSINEKKGEYYRGYRNHFFLINNDSVVLHLYDSGLLTIPFEYCVTRDTKKELFIDDIPEENEEITVDRMDEIDLEQEKTEPMVKGNTYIICRFDKFERTYVFNEASLTFREINKLEEISYSVNFNDAYIIARYNNNELSINRVSGKATIEGTESSNGQCNLTDRRKF